MSPFMNALRDLGMAWWSVAVHSCWQFTVVALVVWVLVRWLRHSPAWIHVALLALALGKGVVPPFWSAPTGLFGAVQIDAGSSAPSLLRFSANAPGPLVDRPTALVSSADRAAPVTGDSVVMPANTEFAPLAMRTTTTALESLTTLAFLVYALGVLGFLALWYRRARRLHASARTTVAVEDRAVRTVFEHSVRKLGLRRAPRLRTGPSVREPHCFGWPRGTILLPPRLLEVADPSTLRAVLVHELTHLRHRDPLLHTLHLLVLALWWFHPLAWLLRAELLRAQENWCDETTVRILRMRSEDYCRTLLQVAANGTARGPLTLGSAMAPTEHALARRFRRLMLHSPKKGRLSMFTPAVLPAFALALLPGVKLRSSHPVPQHDEAVISDGFAGAVQPARVRSPSAAQDPASALDRSLAWLCAHQQSDGSFTEANEPEDASAYATLALLGSGSTSKVGLDPALMANAVSYLYQALRSDTVGFDRGLYAHVVCEALVLGCEGPDLGVLQNLLDSLANSEPASVSAAFWRGMLAASAKDCSLAVPANLRSSAMTVLQRTRSGHEAEVATAAEFLLCALHEQDAPKTKTRFTALEPSHFAKDALGLAIGAMASFQAGRITFNAWQTGVIGPRLAEQRRTGDSGCWDPAKSSSLDAVSETALVAFAAEATYRYAKIQSSD